MKTLIVGNLGYVGPLVVNRFRDQHPESKIFGFDMGYFEHVLTTKSY